MKSFPSIASISPPVETDDMQTAVYNWLGASRQLIGGGAPQTKTIASGTLTPDEDMCFWILIDTEAAAASDDLDRLGVTNIPNGAIVILQAANTARTVVVRHSQGGSGQFLNANVGSFSLDDTEKFIMYRYSSSGTSFVELTRGWGADVAALRAYLALGTAAISNVGTGASDLPTNTQIFDTARDYTRQQRFVRAELTDAASISWDLDIAQIARLPIAGNRTLLNPTNIKGGGQYQLLVFQDATGGRTLSYGSAYKWPNGVAPVIYTTANIGTMLTFTGGNGGQMYGTVSGPYSP